jgi:hypothetical protein
MANERNTTEEGKEIIAALNPRERNRGCGVGSDETGKSVRWRKVEFSHRDRLEATMPRKHSKRRSTFTTIY